MYLQTLALQHFKNYSSAQFNFSKDLNFITGSNGSGKTNVLDAIHYLCLGKSYFNYSDINSVQHDHAYFRIEGIFTNTIRNELTCTFQSNNRKELQKNGVVYNRIADHVGFLPVVMITPYDQLLIDEGSEDRRRFIDNTISQIDHGYLENLISYNRVLQQRNASLKQFASTARPDRTLIDVFDERLYHFGKLISEVRDKYFSMMMPMIGKFYAMISDQSENIQASYESICKSGDLLSALHDSFQKDCATFRTNKGIHRDDFDFFMGGKSMKRFGSQGQKKSFLMALKFSQHELICSEKNKIPLLLIDDLFDKLDAIRAENILSIISKAEFGQVFITDTNENKILKFTVETQRYYHHFSIDHGITKLNDH